MAGAVDRFVEAHVLIVIGIRAIGLGVRLAGLVDLHELRDFVFGRTLGRKPAAHAFEFRHDLEHLDQFGEAELRHHSAAPGPDLDKAGRGQLQKRLADRCARRAEPFGKRHLVQPRAGRELLRDDLLLDGATEFLAG